MNSQGYVCITKNPNSRYKWETCWSTSNICDTLGTGTLVLDTTVNKSSQRAGYILLISTGIQHVSITIYQLFPGLLMANNHFHDAEIKIIVNQLATCFTLKSLFLMVVYLQQIIKKNKHIYIYTYWWRKLLSPPTSIDPARWKHHLSSVQNPCIIPSYWLV